jgi:hypothetical protein
MNYHTPTPIKVTIDELKATWEISPEEVITTVDLILMKKNPFSFHVSKHRESTPKYFLNYQGPIDAAEMYFWYG